MKRALFLPIAVYLGCFLLIPQAKADNYIKNRAPLAEVPFTQLPIGSVKAEGWLLKQLQLQKDGLTGHAEMLYNGNNDLGTGSDWLGGTGDSWERVPYYLKGLVALAYELDNDSLKTKAQKWIEWTLNHQQRSGFFGPVNNKDWWPRMPMLYALKDYFEATGDSRVIPFFTKYFQYQYNYLDTQPLDSWGKSRAGDNIELVFWLYNRTGEAFLLDLADKLKNQAYDWTDIFTNNKFNQFGADFQPKHNVNVPQAMKMPAVYYQKSLSQADRDAFTVGREHLMGEHGQPHGMESGNEMLAGKSSLTGLELCSAVEQMQTCETVQMILGDASIGDLLEKVAFNALPGGLTNDMKGLQYYQQANQVVSKFGYIGFAQNYDNGNMPGPYSGYGCCRFNFHMGFPYFVKTMWAATPDNGLAAMAYAPCTVNALVADNVKIGIHEITNYPFDEQLTFVISADQSAKFPLKFRIPSWCKSPEIKVNNVAQSNIVPGEFYTILRTWSNNDVVSINFPMPINVNQEVNNAVSIQRGPLVYSLKMNENWSVHNDYGNGFREYEVSPASAWNYALEIDQNHPENSIQVNRLVNGSIPENPFAEPPVTLSVSARKLPSWTLSHNERIATDPPYGPVETSEQPEQITLVPYGSETLRVTCFPVVGEKKLITGNFTENFSNGQKGWVQYSGSFYVKDGEYYAGTLEASHPCSKSVVPATNFSDFIYDAKIQVSSSGDAGLMFRASCLSLGPDEYSGYYALISSERQQIEIGKADGSWHFLIASKMQINANQWYNIRVVARGNNIKFYVDDMNVPKIDFNDNSYSSGCIGVRSYNATAVWDDISVVSLAGTKVSTPKATNKIVLYPNPVSKDLAINIPQSGCLAVYDAAGKQIYSTNVTSGTAILNTDGYSDGIYLVKLISDKGTDIAKFVKRKG